MLVKIILCVLVADFITGVIHWWEDTYGDPRWPLIGKEVIEPNIIHHEQPGRLGSQSTFIGRNYQTVIPAVIVTFLFYIYYGFYWPFFLVAFLAAFGNEVHTWNHRSKNNFIIKFLQDTCIIQTPYHHAVHHKPPYNVRFCTITNIVNPILDNIKFWSMLEWFLRIFLKVSPTRMTKIRRGY